MKTENNQQNTQEPVRAWTKQTWYTRDDHKWCTIRRPDGTNFIDMKDNSTADELVLILAERDTLKQQRDEAVQALTKITNADVSESVLNIAAEALSKLQSH